MVHVDSDGTLQSPSLDVGARNHDLTATVVGPMVKIQS